MIERKTGAKNAGTIIYKIIVSTKCKNRMYDNPKNNYWLLLDFQHWIRQKKSHITLSTAATSSDVVFAVVL